jgi:murein L,D-transpeptidase YcbB/YkuD
MVLVAAACAALAACGVNGRGDGGEGAAAVQPSQVSPEALRAQVHDRALVRFYEARNWQPAWTADASTKLVAAIRSARRHGLDPDSFLDPVMRASAPAAREAALSVAALAYAGALAHGRTNPKRMYEIYEIRRPDPDLAAGLNRALADKNVGAWIAGLAPQDAEYRALSEAYLAASEAASGGHPPAIPSGDAIRPGAADSRLPAIAAALAANGYLAAPAEPPTRYASALVDAVRHLQEDYGLAGDGVIDAPTLAALNETPFEHARTLAVALERLRWLPREAPATRIDVNTAASVLTYWQEGHAADRRRVVTGEPGRETPQLASPLYRLVANPTWTIPHSIEGEVTSKGSGYMSRNHISRKGDFLVQASGPQNSLGLVKFDLRNDHAIYLHDTPAKTLFGQDDRHSSHGCVRVQDALVFAEMIARDAGVTDQWRQARARHDESFVPLPRPIPVRLLYHTAFVEGGRVRYRLDAYGWDEDVAEALGLAARPRPQYVPREGDIGP